MTRMVEILIAGVSAGALYGLIALAFSIVFKATSVMNFALGSFLVLGGYIVATASTTLGFFGALTFAIVAVGLLAVLVDQGIMRWVRNDDHVLLAIITLGIDLMLLSELTRRIGSKTLSLHDPWGSNLIRIVDVTVPETRIAALLIIAMILGAFFFALRKSNWGVAMRACTQDTEAAWLVGIRPARVTASAWFIGGALAAVAGVFTAVFPTPGLTPGAASFALQAFPAAVLGGIDSLGGALVGGMAIGLATALAAGYSYELAFLGSGFSGVVPYLVLVVVLLVRPTGLFGSKEMLRV